MGKQGGPLAGYRVIEFAGLAPVPFAGMILADFGADVVCFSFPASLFRSFAPDVAGICALPTCALL